MLDERMYVLESGSHGPYAIVTATGEIDVAAVGDLCGAIEHAATRSARVVVDLRPVTFMDTFALRALVSFQDESSRAGDWSLHVVAGSSPCVQRLLDLAGARCQLRWMAPEQLAR
jgi:anti-anti-sigma factor